MSLAFDEQDDFLIQRADESPEDRLDAGIALMDSAAETVKQRQHDT